MHKIWARFWMFFAGPGVFGKVATCLAASFAPPYFSRIHLAGYNPKGYFDPQASISHALFFSGEHVFIDARVTIVLVSDGGPVEFGDRVHIYRDTIIQTGAGGSISIGDRTHVQPRCIFSAFKSPIKIGSGVQIAPNCGFYPYDHGIESGIPISKQPLRTKGGIVIDDDAWLGTGVIVLDGVRIGRGAVIGAGAVVTGDIPDNAVAAGIPARVIRYRDDSAVRK